MNEPSMGTMVLKIPEVAPIFELANENGALVTIRPDGSVRLHQPVDEASKAFWDQVHRGGISLLRRLTVVEVERDAFRDACRRLTEEISALKNAKRQDSLPRVPTEIIDVRPFTRGPK